MSKVSNIDLAGKRFGKWLVKHADTTARFPMAVWYCICDCGTDRILRTSALRKSKSCGCSKNDKRPHLWKSYSGPLNTIFKSYVRSAKIRNYEFELSLSQFETLIKGNCAFCGVPPETIGKFYWGKDFLYNGIDRLDNAVGYTMFNSVSCCKKCNLAKRNLPLGMFLEWTRRITKFTNDLVSRTTYFK